ncbi:hypothetical protein EON81_15020 [bacterium]|nr:MAG: hypothetical protein EON81_15020 [bacterium]
MLKEICLVILVLCVTGCRKSLLRPGTRIDDVEIVLDSLRSAEIELVRDKSLPENTSGKVALFEKNGKIPIPPSFLKGLDSFYNIRVVRDKRGRTIQEWKKARKGDLAYTGGFVGINFKTYLEIKRKK